MKNIKCPLCGGMPQFATKDIDEIEVCQILCKCGLATEVNEYWLNSKDDPEEDELRAWKDWEKLVSKFPLIMRLKIGDELVVNESNSGYHYFRVTEIYINNSTFFGICLKTNELEQFKCEDVSEWPWELEQKGEQEQ